MKELGYGVERLKSSDYSEEEILTKRQEEIIRYAFEHGYYEVPKKITLEELGSAFDISKSTASVIIRDAEKKLITFCLQSNDIGIRE
jgi:predicted DNA binding protein